MRPGDLIRITLEAGLGQTSQVIGLLISSTPDEQYDDMFIHIRLLTGDDMCDMTLIPAEDRIEVISEAT